MVYGDLVDKKSRFLRTMDFPVVTKETGEYRGKTVNIMKVETRHLSALFSNVSKDKQSHHWSVSLYREDQTIYPDGFYTGGSSSGGKDGIEKTFNTFAETVQFMRAWELEMLESYTGIHNDEAIRVSADGLAHLMDNSFLSQLAGAGSKSSRIDHWSTRVREYGLLIEETDNETARALWSGDRKNLPAPDFKKLLAP